MARLFGAAPAGFAAHADFGAAGESGQDRPGKYAALPRLGKSRSRTAAFPLKNASSKSVAGRGVRIQGYSAFPACRVSHHEPPVPTPLSRRPAVPSGGSSGRRAKARGEASPRGLVWEKKHGPFPYVPCLSGRRCIQIRGRSPFPAIVCRAGRTQPSARLSPSAVLCVQLSDDPVVQPHGQHLPEKQEKLILKPAGV